MWLSMNKTEGWIFIQLTDEDFYEWIKNNSKKKLRVLYFLVFLIIY
jgi:hypothetical protein